MDKKWYLAEILQEIRVKDEESATVYVNLILVNANDSEEAYTKSLIFGEQENYEYDNTDGELVTSRFKGLRNLYEIYEELEDGAEILYEAYDAIASAEIDKMIKPKDQLAVFKPRELKE